jgi:hypothetical protein
MQKKTTCLPERGWGRWQMQKRAKKKRKVCYRCQLLEAERQRLLAMEVELREAKSDAIDVTDDERFICDDAGGGALEPLTQSDDEECESENEENEENTPSADEQRAVEQLAAQAAEVRALRLATAGALLQQRGAFLALVTARRDMVHGKSVSSSEQSVLEKSVTQARANTAVAQAREQLAQAKLEALQLAAEIVVRASAE